MYKRKLMVRLDFTFSQTTKMVHISLIAVIAFACLASAKVIPLDGGRIVGGAPADEGQFPHQISLRYFGSHRCGGSIYNKRWIITAAHCVEGIQASYLQVVTGSTRLSSGGDTYQVERILIHPDWNSAQLIDDMAMMKLASDIQFNDKVKAIPISSRYVQESPAVASGWGTTSFPGSAPDRLQFVDLMTVTNAYCQQRHSSNAVRESAICTYTKSGEGMCHGDSGGPLVVDGELTGIVSWGRPCAVGYPDVFTRVFSFKSWIEQNAVV